jgi:Dyp-type peroxidase family
MTINLDQTLSWTQAHAAMSPAAAAQLAMLHDLQGNILKGHGRHFTSNIFVRFDPARASAARRFVASIGHDVTSALDQLLGAEAHKASGTDAGAFITVLLAAAGYDALGRGDAKPPGDAFNAGMAARALNDPPATGWDQALQAPHALILVGTSDPAWRDSERQAILARIAATGGAVVHTGHVDGNALFNRGDGLGIEHFGYVDGRSQPLALQEDVDHEAAHGGTDQWDPAIHLRQLLVRCPGGALDVSHGSFFVFRKLEQNVRGFKLREEELAAALDAERAAKGLPVEPVGERAGASVVGRFENGTPVSLSPTEVALPAKRDDAVRNNFNFSTDLEGLKCPYAAHIRKSNPRDDAPNSKSHLMARRGIPYGRRDDDPNDGRTDNKPTGDVGLIFMAYQASIEDQFEFTQNAWVNNPQFARPLLRPGPVTGIDPVIGQKPTPLPEPPIAGQLYPLDWGQQLSDRPFDFSDFVTMRGGEYLFAPAISFLKSLR